MMAIMLSMYHLAGNLMPDITRVLEELDKSEVGVMVALIIHNHSGYRLVLEDVDVSCGMFSNNGSMPEVLNPGGAYVVYSEKVVTCFILVMLLLLKYETFNKLIILL